MITYPVLKKGATIGITAPSSGVQKPLHPLLKDAVRRNKERGYRVTCGETAWTQDKSKSAPAKQRADEFNAMMQDEAVDIIIPPWGGQLLIEILEHLDFHSMQTKWVLGYSNTSLLLLAITLNTGTATAHGTNVVDIRGEYMDETTAQWESVLATEKGQSVMQTSSDKYQKEWQFDKLTPCVFHLTEQTVWKTVSGNSESIKGRLLGGCLDVIRHLIGTPFGHVQKFRNAFIPGESVVWYFENSQMSAAELRRTLVHMKLGGWFDYCSGILFGRSPANTPVENYTAEDVYSELAEELNVPVVYDIDCGHVPPQITFINGAYADIDVQNSTGIVRQYFK